MDLEKFKSGLTNQQSNLLEAVQSGTLAEVKQLFPQFRNLDRNEELFNYILLVNALHRGHKSISKFLIKKDCKVKIPMKTKAFCTPVYYAVKLKDVDLCKEFCKRGASIHYHDANEESALELAMLQRNYDIIKYFLKYYLQQARTKLKPDNEEDIALFHAACFISSWDTLTFVKDLKFSTCSHSGFTNKEWRGYTALHFVMGRNTTPSVVLTIWEHEDTDVFAQDENGRTPLHLAFRSRSFLHDLTYFYVEHTKDLVFVNLEDRNGLSHFHIICFLRYHANNFSYGKYLSILKGFINTVENINSSVSLEDEEYPGYTALHFAAKYSCPYVVKLLLENGADPSRVDKDGRTPLHIALGVRSFPDGRGERSEIVEILLEHKANVDAQDVQNCTPLHQAFCMRKDNEKLFQILLSKSQLTTNLTECSGLSYFHIACSVDDLSKVKMLMRNGASVNSQVTTQYESQTDLFLCQFDYKGYSALHFAIKFNAVTVVEHLLSCGADVNLNLGHTTPLHMACTNDIAQFNLMNPEHNPHFDWSSNRYDRVRIIKLLLQYNGLINLKDSHGCTPLLKACSIPWDLTFHTSSSYCGPEKKLTYFDSLLNEISVRQEIIVNILVCYGADVNSRDNAQECTLHFLARYYKACPSAKKSAQIVLKRGANVNVVNNVGVTPFHVAVEESITKKLDTSLIELFLKYGANINAKTEQLDTALHCAVENYESDPICQKIIETLMYTPKIDVSIQNLAGDTPLHIAVRRQKNFCVGGLLVFESNINLKNSDGDTPIHIACQWSIENFDLKTAEKYSIRYLMITHVKRLMMLKRFVSDGVRAVYESLVQHHPNMSSKAEASLVEEVRKLKSKNVDQYTSLFEILLKDPDNMAKHVRNAQFIKMLSYSQLTIDFPLFYQMLINQVRRGRIRYLVLRPAKEALKLITKFDWPDSCAEHILKYLNNDDLEVFIKSSNLPNTRKRLCQNSPPCKQSAMKVSRSK